MVKGWVRFDRFGRFGRLGRLAWQTRGPNFVRDESGGASTVKCAGMTEARQVSVCNGIVYVVA